MSDIVYKKLKRRCENIQQLLHKQVGIKPGTLVKTNFNVSALPADDLENSYSNPTGDSNRDFFLPKETVLMFIAVVPDLSCNSPVYKFLYNELFITVGPLIYYDSNGASKEQAQSVQKFCFSFEKVS